MSIALMVPVSMCPPSIVVSEYGSLRSLNVTTPENEMFCEDICAPLAVRRITLLVSPLVTESESEFANCCKVLTLPLRPFTVVLMPLTVCESCVYCPSRLLTEVCKPCAVCCKLLTWPSRVLTLVLRLCEVCVSCVILPSASSTREVRDAEVCMSVETLPSVSLRRL